MQDLKILNSEEVVEALNNYKPKPQGGWVVLSNTIGSSLIHALQKQLIKNKPLTNKVKRVKMNYIPKKEYK